jgi:small subunit ribosomal protein S17
MIKERVGIVLSDKMAKTRVVRAERLVRGVVYRKVSRIRKKFYVHDEENVSKVGDWVRIQEMRPLSRTKRWKLLEVIEKAK